MCLKKKEPYSLIELLKKTKDNDFLKLPYTEAVETILKSGVKFQEKIEWGSDLSIEHEKFICNHYQKPVIIYDYPEKIKSFYMKLNDDKKTV